MLTIAFVIAAYLLGSVSFAIIACKLFKLPDPRTYGSGNPGATNVLRSGKKAAAVLTLVGDAAKGWLAVLLTMHHAPADNMLIAAVTLAVFLGHLYPIFLRFQGGKGVATALGVLLALSPWVGLGALLIWLLIAVVFRYSSLAALVAAAVAPIYIILLGLPFEWSIATMLMAMLLFYRHQSNIRNLISGKESKIGQKKGA